jgi:hypothetical protein
MSEIVYLVEFKLPDFPWTHWQACGTLEEAEQALTARRKELAEPAGQRVSFRIVKHETLANDVAGPIDVAKCSLGHNFAKLPSHPRDGEASYCPHCLVSDKLKLREELLWQDKHISSLTHTINDAQEKIGKLASIVLKFIMSADKTTSAEAFAAYEKYKEETKE